MPTVLSAQRETLQFQAAQVEGELGKALDSLERAAGRVTDGAHADVPGLATSGPDDRRSLLAGRSLNAGSGTAPSALLAAPGSSGMPESLTKGGIQAVELFRGSVGGGRDGPGMEGGIRLPWRNRSRG
jgi:hypothetical protein